MLQDVTTLRKETCSPLGWSKGGMEMQQNSKAVWEWENGELVLKSKAPTPSVSISDRTDRAIYYAKHTYSSDYCSISQWRRALRETSQNDIAASENAFKVAIEKVRKEADALSDAYQNFRTALYQVECEHKEQERIRQEETKRKEQERVRQEELQRQSVTEDSECTLSPHQLQVLEDSPFRDTLKKMEYAFANIDSEDPQIARQCDAILMGSKDAILECAPLVANEANMKIIQSLLEKKDLFSWQSAILVLIVCAKVIDS